MTSSETLTVEPGAKVAPAAASRARPEVRGKFLFVDGKKFYVKGVTYGPFRPDEQGCEYHDPQTVERDFSLMAVQGINAVRLYTVPPRWLLDVALRCGLKVMIGLPWEQHIAFLSPASRQRSIENRVRAGVRQCANHPAVLAYAVGNEIPSTITRWYGRRRVERFIHRLYRAAKSEDPAALVTFVNYPTTEYLQLPFLDFICFNVYLEDRAVLTKYLARLQNMAAERPLVMGEVGLDSRRNGHQKQAQVLDWQISTAFEAGCAGIFVFAWTDEWHRGGFDIDDWDFGLCDRQRNLKPAMASVARSFAQAPFAGVRDWPRVSVVVCTYNGSRTIQQTCAALREVDYPNFEVLVVNDGSTDRTGEILRGERGIRLLEIPNGGLSNARNVGFRNATGQIVVYLDDDAYPDPHWLSYLAHTFMTTDYAAVGGPNLHVPEDCDTALCVAWSPGGPNHVLLTDTQAEHIPGCNMAFRKSALEAVGGFDPTFRIAGDDVDLCWRLEEHGWKIGFHPAAQVWHHRRNTVRGYLRQQTNYGRAEAMLEAKWPGKFNDLGHVSWSGRLYSTGMTVPLVFGRSRVYHGPWGTGLFQTLYAKRPGVLASLPLMPEWYLLVATLLLGLLLGVVWDRALYVWPFFLAVVGISLTQAVLSAVAADLRHLKAAPRRWKCRALIAALHLLQPIVRLKGRLMQGLRPWERSGKHERLSLPRIRQDTIWSETWRSPEDRLADLEAAILELAVRPARGGDYDAWDLEIPGGVLGTVRLVMAIEEHGGGRQLVRLRAWPRMRRNASAILVVSLLVTLLAIAMQFPVLATVFVIVAASVGVLAVGDCAWAMAAYRQAIQSQTQPA